MTATTPFEFDADTDVDVVGDHEYAVALSDRWNALRGVVNGGYMLAVCLQALRRELPFPDPMAVSAYYLRPGAPGAATLRTEIVRVGRRMATGEVQLHQGSDEVVRALASFTDLEQASGRTVMLGEMPSLPPPEECMRVDGSAALPGVTIADRVEYRYPEPPGWLTGEPSGEPHAEFWLRFTDGRAADPLGLALLVDAAAPAVLDIGATASSTVELTVHVRGRPAPGWLACRVSTRHIIDGHHEEDFEVWDSSGKFVAQARQLARLVPDEK